MELKQVLLLSLISYTAYALSLNSILDQINSYVASPLSLFLSSEDSDPISHTPKQPIHADATFPCCVCSGCICSHTSCPQIVPFPSPPSAHWPIDSGAPIEIVTAGCGANYTVEACLHFVQQYLHALQPALERASYYSGEHQAGQGEKNKKKKGPCCGDGCSEAHCLNYLAVAVKNLEAPINKTLDSVERKIDTEPASGSEVEEGKVKSEL